MNEFSEAPYSANFKMFRPDGLQINFTVRSNANPQQHIAELDNYLQALTNRGYAPQLPGLEPGEEAEQVDGWVLGETSKGDACVYLYKSPLKWKIATVYVERLGELPIDTSKAKVWPGSAPERETAVNKKYLQPCDFSIVMEPTGKQSENGHDIMRFGRVKEISQPAAPAPAVADPFDARDVALSAPTRAVFFANTFTYMQMGETCYSEQGNVEAIANLVAANWLPDGGKGNVRMLDALNAYCSKRREVEAGGAASNEAHSAGMVEARRAWNRK